jgi:hypothetical protein
VTVEERLEALERKVKLYRRVFLAACILSIVLAGTSAIAVQSKEIHANKFVLEDDSGKVCGIWSVNDRGQTILAFLDKNNEVSASLSSTEDHVGLRLYGTTTAITLLDTETNTGIFATVTPGNNTLRIRDNIILWTDKDGTPRIEVGDKDHNLIWTTPVRK